MRFDKQYNIMVMGGVFSGLLVGGFFGFTGHPILNIGFIIFGISCGFEFAEKDSLKRRVEELEKKLK